MKFIVVKDDLQDGCHAAQVTVEITTETLTQSITIEPKSEQDEVSIKGLITAAMQVGADGYLDGDGEEEPVQSYIPIYMGGVEIGKLGRNLEEAIEILSNLTIISEVMQREALAELQKNPEEAHIDYARIAAFISRLDQSSLEGLMRLIESEQMHRARVSPLPQVK